ncbi:nucleoid-associated protein YejK [Thalassotalea piscium]|uniref:Nucleoid-associated protein n=1 Tax=Thalassotalea piscium TaxID=1230533 RepID=A0A7X0NFH1_9GAMM|nr:nucleoid-associated protein YejK [Thalassotalea piscium]MBB6542378.1 nucleoid-associated protein [Thalassotalea piscium]
MSLIISNIALHFLSQKTETGEVELRFGPESIAITPKIEDFTNGLHTLYNSKGSKGYGRFTDQVEPSETPRFVDIMESYFNEQLSFNDFSQQAAKGLANELTKYDLAETGYLVLTHYEYMGGRYLLVAVIPVSEHYSVDQELTISAAKHLDIAKLQLAVRIDLFDYQQNPDSNRYVSFIKGRAGRKVSDFFLDFLGCEEGMDSKVQTQVLVQAVEDFVAVNQFDPQEKQQTRKELLNYCKEQKESAQEVSLKEVGKVVSTDQEKDFYQFCQEQAYPLEEQFPHDQAIVNKVTKYSGYGNGISISFERSHFGQDIVYNKANDSLTIYKVPPNLKEQLLALLSSNDNDNTEY